MKHLDNDFGFSLIEVMTVVAVLGIVAAMGGGVSSKLFRVNKSSEEVIKLQEALQSVRNLAITSDKCGSITVLNSTTLRVIKYDTCQPAMADPQPTEDIAFTRISLSEFNVGPTIHFLPRGRLDQANPVTLDLTTDTEAFQIKIMPAVGSIRFKKM